MVRIFHILRTIFNNFQNQKYDSLEFFNNSTLINMYFHIHILILQIVQRGEESHECLHRTKRMQGYLFMEGSNFYYRNLA